MAPSSHQKSRSRSSKTASGSSRFPATRQPSIRFDPRGCDLYARITDQIIAAVEAGAGAWRMPWHHDGTATSRPTNAVTGRRYRGINTLALWAATETAGYAQGLWATYAQWHAAGAQVRKGERATTVVLWKELPSADQRDDNAGPDRDEQHSRVVARAFSVFNSA